MVWMLAKVKKIGIINHEFYLIIAPNLPIRENFPDKAGFELVITLVETYLLIKSPPCIVTSVQIFKSFVSIIEVIQCAALRIQSFETTDPINNMFE